MSDVDQIAALGLIRPDQHEQLHSPAFLVVLQTGNPFLTHRGGKRLLSVLLAAPGWHTPDPQHTAHLIQQALTTRAAAAWAEMLLPAEMQGAAQQQSVPNTSHRQHVQLHRRGGSGELASWSL